MTRATFQTFLSNSHSRDEEWSVTIPDDLQDRRVEITGPTDRKMIINALNSGANVFMADFEDANSPTWHNLIDGQQNLCDAVAARITFTSPEGKKYRLNETTATLMVRPRGWHLPEKHVCLDGKPMSGSLFDFGLFFFHNARQLLEKGTGPYFYLPKLESHLEARLWNDVFLMAQDELGIPRGSIRATVLIETIPAAFEMDEILYELREHSAGLNCGRWDYIFSIIKKFRKHPAFIMPDRALVTMTTHCMHSYSLLAIKTCHRRGVHAIGGMAAQIPIKNDPRGERGGAWKRSVPTSSARRATATTAHGSPTRGWCPSPKRFSTPTCRRLTRFIGSATTCRCPAKDLLTVPQGEITERGPRAERRCRHAIHGRLAGRQRLRAPLQPHGGRGDRRNLPRPGLAMGPPAQRRACRRAKGDARVGPRAFRGACRSTETERRRRSVLPSGAAIWRES